VLYNHLQEHRKSCTQASDVSTVSHIRICTVTFESIGYDTKVSNFWLTLCQAAASAVQIPDRWVKSIYQ
jgi:hypothetical protein